MSPHMKHSLKLLGGGAIVLLGAYLWLAHHIRDIIVPPRAVLPRNDKEIVAYDENHHVLAVTTEQGTTRTYSRNPTVEIRKDGTVKVDGHSWGLELRPFLGAGYSDAGRVYTGCQAFYFRQFDMSASLGWVVVSRKLLLQPTLAVGYNFWSNTSINVGANPVSFIGAQKPEIAVFLSVRL